MRIEREWLEQLIFGVAEARRFTQDSPILPDVWIRYGTADHADPLRLSVDLLLTPHRNDPVGKVADVLAEYLEGARAEPRFEQQHPDYEPTGLAYNQTTVVARLYFDELLRAVLPMSKWWQDYGGGPRNKPIDFESAVTRKRLADALDVLEKSESARRGMSADSSRRGWTPTAELLWLVRLAGVMLAASKEPDLDSLRERERRFQAILADHPRIAREFCDAIAGHFVPGNGAPKLFMVSVNRRAAPSVSRSVLAIKADAARLLFGLSCEQITWAILDTGIDATHPAFRARDPDGKKLDAKGRKLPFAKPFGAKARNQTRVKATYDFTLVRLLLSPDADDIAGVIKRLERASKRTDAETSEGRRLRRELERWKRLAELEIDRDQLRELRKSLGSGRTLNWSALDGVLEMAHADYVEPTHDHGTHVAGILGADWAVGCADSSGRETEQDVTGVCPDINLYDFRVLDENGRGDEFSIIAAMQYIRTLNANRDVPVIHGVNLSLSIRHDVANYACGRTPVCDEAERLVAAGVVVVTAAGNDGYMHYTTPEGRAEGYRSISITDPGNAEGVITVGATHRYQPHTYGVSYFSSRGPTGDGRIKPDLVAPGEKIEGPVPSGLEAKDGTSMAAPHVSGAAALLMSRHRELVGQPQRVKQILCRTATDLGRERYFQGSGMLDVLRALQEI
jgi:subtilisin family serine protease